jgi:hypothetical protein
MAASLLELATVFALGAAELWGAIPVGLALGLPAWVVGVTSGLGAIAGAALTALLGERLRRWLLSRRRAPVDAEPAPGRVAGVWRRYGAVGLGLTAPMITGAVLAVALGMAFGAPARRIVLWTALGVVLWTIVLTLLGALGRAGIAASV